VAVFVLDTHKQPLMPCSEKRARLLLERGRARIHKMRPFTIRIVDRTVEDSALQPLVLKIDPGSKTTGIAIVRESADENGKTEHHVAHLAELTHRGAAIRDAIASRRSHRRRRRGNLRFRPKRFDNRRRPDGWLPPSLQSRVDNVTAWAKRYQAAAPIAHVVIESTRFDTQLLENPEISGVEYQQGTLAGYEIREYVLEKWHRTCAYCDAKNVALTIDHIHPRAKGGSDRPSNLTLACEPCNLDKGAQDIKDFLTADPKRLARILAETKRPLRDAAAINATRYAGGRTKFNRSRLNIPKTHALDAACAGAVENVLTWSRPVLAIKATGRGQRQRALPNRFGFPRGHRPRVKLVRGFQTGDLVRAIVPAGKKAGTHSGRVAVRSSGKFNIQTPAGVLQGISHRHCALIQRASGYAFAFTPKTQSTFSSPT
jgi:5-methylcytosine-specific restriction endonuclease McrA